MRAPGCGFFQPWQHTTCVCCTSRLTSRQATRYVVLEHRSRLRILGTHFGLGSWDPFERPGSPRASPLTCRCYICAFQHTGSGRVCTPVDCRTHCNGAELAASAWSTLPNCRHAGEEVEDGECTTLSTSHAETRHFHPPLHLSRLHSELSIVFCPMPNPVPAKTSPAALPIGCHLSLKDPPLAPSPVINTRRNASPRRKMHVSAQGPIALSLEGCRQAIIELFVSPWLPRRGPPEAI